MEAQSHARPCTSTRVHTTRQLTAGSTCFPLYEDQFNPSDGNGARPARGGRAQAAPDRAAHASPAPPLPLPLIAGRQGARPARRSPGPRRPRYARPAPYPRLGAAGPQTAPPTPRPRHHYTAPAADCVARRGPGPRPASAHAHNGVGRRGPGLRRSRYAYPASAHAHDGVLRRSRYACGILWAHTLFRVYRISGHIGYVPKSGMSDHRISTYPISRILPPGRTGFDIGPEYVRVPISASKILTPWNSWIYWDILVYHVEKR